MPAAKWGQSCSRVLLSAHFAEKVAEKFPFVRFPSTVLFPRVSRLPPAEAQEPYRNRTLIPLFGGGFYTDGPSIEAQGEPSSPSLSYPKAFVPWHGVSCQFRPIPTRSALRQGPLHFGTIRFKTERIFVSEIRSKRHAKPRLENSNGGVGAGNRGRTGDIHLGKVALYH